MKYGNSTLSGKFVLGPMAAYTDIAFRLLCRRAGAAMCFTEFANADAIAREIAPTMRLLRTCPEEMPVGIQIFGSDEKAMAHACKRIGGMVQEGLLSASCIDINFGCPAGTVIRSGSGSALLKKPEKIEAIVESCVGASELPITCKIRSGWNSDNAVGIARLVEKAGASGVTIHWRNAREGRKRKDDWASVGEVKKAVGIPVIGNGGASTPELAVRMLEETGCDAVMISSGALGNPGIFRRSNALLEKNCLAEEAWGEKLAFFLEYAALAEKYGVLAPKPLRAHAIEFLTGQPGVKIARKMLNEAKTAESIISVMEKFEPATRGCPGSGYD